MTLYDIDKRFNNLMEFGVDSDTGECVETDEDFKRLYDEIQMDLNDKIENSAKLIKNVTADIEEFKKEEDKLKHRREVKEHLVERVKRMIDGYIKNLYTDENGVIDYDKLNKYKFDRTAAKISYRKSDSLSLTEISQVPKQYIKSITVSGENLTPNIISENIMSLTEKDIDKAGIKKDIKNGVKVKGAEIINNYNMQIK